MVDRNRAETERDEALRVLRTLRGYFWIDDDGIGRAQIAGRIVADHIRWADKALGRTEVEHG